MQRTLSASDQLLTALKDDKPDDVHKLLSGGEIQLANFLTDENLQNLFDFWFKAEKDSGAQPGELVTNLILHLGGTQEPVGDGGCCWPWCGEAKLKQDNAQRIDRDREIMLGTLAKVIRYLVRYRELTIHEFVQYLLPDVSKEGQTRRYKPEDILFAWAVLLNRKELAFKFLELCSCGIGAALTASAMLKSLSEEADKMDELNLSQSFKNTSEEFERVAEDILDGCFKKDRKRTGKLLGKTVPAWDDTTLDLLEIGRSSTNFMGHTACQQQLARIWRGKMMLHTSIWMILANLFIPITTIGIKYVPAWKKRILQKKSFCETNYSSAPVVKFCYNTISQIIFLVFFSYFLLCDLHPLSESKSPGAAEIIVWIWVITLVVEELRQFWTSPGDSVFRKLVEYIGNDWNVLEDIAHGLFAFAVLLRLGLTEQDFHWARAVYCVSLALYFIRVMQVFDINRTIGPKVIMIREMIFDLMFFLCILLVFLLAFGVAYQALRYPNSEVGWRLLKDVLYMPYWQMYGELFLEELEGDPGECSKNETEWRMNPNIERCPEQSKLVVALLALYTVITHLLLLSLLVAMFTQTFERVQIKSEKMWRLNLYGLVNEFSKKPTLPPPFIIINHCWRLFKFLRYLIKKPPKTCSGLIALLTMNTPDTNDSKKEDDVENFEREVTKNYFEKQNTAAVVEEVQDILRKAMEHNIKNGTLTNFKETLNTFLFKEVYSNNVSSN